jgi:hypothetical protein
MRKTAYFLAAVAVVFAAASCTLNGPAGPAGENLYEISFQEGMYPDSTYSGCDDTYIGNSAGNLNTNRDAYMGMYCGYNGGILRSLLRFNIEAMLPEGAKVKKAYIKLNVNYVTAGKTINEVFYPVTSSWNVSEATWVSRTASAQWGALGGDKGASAVSNNVTVDQNSDYTDFEINASTVQSWLDTPAANHGLMLVSDVEGTTISNYFGYDQSEDAALSVRPKLTVYYTLD